VCARAGGASLGGVLVSGSSASPFFRLGNCMSSLGNTSRVRPARSAARRAPTTVHHNPGATPRRSGRDPSGLVNRHDKHVVVSSLMGVPTNLAAKVPPGALTPAGPAETKRASKIPDADTILLKNTRARSRPRPPPAHGCTIVQPEGCSGEEGWGAGPLGEGGWGRKRATPLPARVARVKHQPRARRCVGLVFHPYSRATIKRRCPGGRV
jgi:hypothetical protein